MAKILKALYSAEKNPLRIDEFEIPCYVLENGQRVLSQGGMLKALGLSSGSASRRGGDRLASFAMGKRVSSLISNDLIMAIKEPVKFVSPNGRTALGYDAETLQQIVRGVAKAYLQGKLQVQQKHIGERAEKLDDAFSKVGLIALIDEATGYQYDRERQELQKILKAYISDELLPWQKRFPDEFYKEIFRLNGWDYTVKGIKQRPSVIGIWTKQLIYSKLPKGVLRELIKKTPKSRKGNYTARFHQSLTSDVGHPHLEKQLVSVITLMNISEDWEEFLKHFNKKFGQLEIPFEERQMIEPKPKELKSGELSSFNQTLKSLTRVPPPKKE